MSNPYYWEFPQRSDTMYMSTIDGSSSFMNKPQRYSSFQKHDIDGSQCRQQIPAKVTRENYSHSSYIEPRPERAAKVKKTSDPLYHGDIEKSFPQAVEFQTGRIVDPIQPKYQLPSYNPVSIAEPRKFLRDNINVTDIVEKKKVPKPIKSPKETPIAGSTPAKLFQSIEAVSRLDVQDINRDGIFVSARRENPTDPLNPSYHWRDRPDDKIGLSFTKNVLKQERKALNQSYGPIQGTNVKSTIKNASKNRLVDLSLQTKDIEGSGANSSNQNRYFFAKRKDYREILKVEDIDKTGASSLKKGISTKRSLNPLMPKYKYPS